jgi:ketopantoate reductase
MSGSVIQPLSTRFHVLGPGSVGSLFAYYFHRHGVPFTLFQRKAAPLPLSGKDSDNDIDNTNIPARNDVRSSYPPTTLKYMDLTSLTTQSVGPQPIDGIDWEPLYPIIEKELFRHDPVYNELSRSPIHHLLVTTKTYQTVDAISKIRHRLRPWTTIVLMQNGMGVQEEICRSLGWTTEEERPNFVQGIISHGAQKMNDSIVHTGRGHVWLSPLSEVDLPTATEGARRKWKSVPLLQNQELLKKDPKGSPYPQVIRPSPAVLTAPYPPAKTVPFAMPFTDTPFTSFYNAPSTADELKNLRKRSFYETLTALQRLSTDMDLHIIMPDHLLALQLSKLVVNACVNPVATLLESTNGGLLDPSENAHPAVKDLLKESHHILSQSDEYQALDETLRQEFLTLDALTKTTEKILRATRQNRCSTLQDYMRGSRQCEIDYMNGYLIKMVERNMAPGTSVEKVAPLNRRVTERIKEKFAAPRSSKL